MTRPPVRSMRSMLRKARDSWLLGDMPNRLARLDASVDDLNFQLGQLAMKESSATGRFDVGDQDVRVFSQWGEDGILNHLVSLLPDIPHTFVEIGIEDYRECNTRFLARSGWTGLALDGDADGIQRAQSLREVWSGHAVVQEAWVEPDTINTVISASGMTGEVGVFSLDVDGVDFYLLDALQAVSPWIIVVEYNARYGPDAAVTVPYRRGFDRRIEHSSWLHHGVSLAGLEMWGQERGYGLVMVNGEGTNAFLVADQHRPDALPARSAKDLWRPLRFSEHRAPDGTLTPVSFAQEQRIVAELPTVDVAELLQRPERAAPEPKRP